MNKCNGKLLFALLNVLIFAAFYPINISATIVKSNGSHVALENDMGCKLEFYYQDGKYGLGTFYFQNENSAQCRLWWSRYERWGHSSGTSVLGAYQYQRIDCLCG